MSAPAPQQVHKSTEGKTYKGIHVHAAAGLHEAVIEHIGEEARPPGSRVLELGCGSGALTQRLVEQEFAVSAVDLSLDTYKAPADAWEIDLNTDFADRLAGTDYDMIVATEVLEHLENPQHFLRQATQLMGPKTTLWVSFPNMYLYLACVSFLRDTTFVNWTVHQYWTGGHQTLLTDWIFTQHAIKAGLKIEASYFVAPVSLYKAHPSLIRRTVSRIILGLLRFLTPNVSLEQRMADCVLFKIRRA